MPRPLQVDEIRDELASIYRAAQESIDQQLAALTVDEGDALRRRVLVQRLRHLADEVERLADDLDDQARRWLAVRYPAVYQLGAEDAQTATRAGFQWTQTHVDAVTELAADAHQDLLAATRYRRRDVKALIREASRAASRLSVLEGDTARRAGRRLARELAERGVRAVRYRNGTRVGVGPYAEMVLRTKTGQAFNSGTLNHLAGGGVEWVEVFDGSDCGWTSHDDGDLANGTVRRLSDARLNALAHPNAVMAGTEVVALGKVNAAYRASWRGPVRQLRTARGSCLTLGPNHPVLTGRGWVSAQLVLEGDYVVRRAVQGSMPVMSSDPHLDERPALVEEVFEALAAVGNHTVVVASPEYLHGDGNFCEGKVEVVWTNGTLTNEPKSSRRQQDNKLVLAVAGAEPSPLSGESTLLLGGERVHLPAPGGMRGSDARGIVVGGSERYATFSQPLSDDAVADSNFCSELQRRFAFEVTLDEIIEVRNVDSWSGQAFDLETTTAAYFADEILVHNCARSFGGRPDVSSSGDAERARRLSPAEQETEAAVERVAATGRERRARQAVRRKERLARRGT